MRISIAIANNILPPIKSLIIPTLIPITIKPDKFKACSTYLRQENPVKCMMYYKNPLEKTGMKPKYRAVLEVWNFNEETLDANQDTNYKTVTEHGT